MLRDAINRSWLCCRRRPPSQRSLQRGLARLSLRERERELSEEIRELEQALEAQFKVEDYGGDQIVRLGEDDYQSMWRELIAVQTGNFRDSDFFLKAPAAEIPAITAQRPQDRDVSFPGRAGTRTEQQALLADVRDETELSSDRSKDRSSYIPTVFSSNLDEAVKQLKELSCSETKLPIHEVHHLIRQCRRENSIQHALKFFHVGFAVGEARVLRGRMGLTPSLKTWELMVNTALHTKSAREGFEIFRMLQSQERMKPSVRIWASMIRMCGLTTNQFGPDPERALEMYDMAQKSIFGSDEATQQARLVAALISALSATPVITRKYFGDILTCLQKDKSVLLESNVANELMRACAKIGDLQRIRLLVDQMIRSSSEHSPQYLRSCLRPLFHAYATCDAKGMPSTGEVAVNDGSVDASASKVSAEASDALFEPYKLLETRQEVIKEARQVFARYRTIFTISDMNAYLSVFAQHATPSVWWEVYDRETRRLNEDDLVEGRFPESTDAQPRNGHTYLLAMRAACKDRTPPILERARTVFDEFLAWRSTITRYRRQPDRLRQSMDCSPLQTGYDEPLLTKKIYCMLSHLYARRRELGMAKTVLQEYLHLDRRRFSAEDKEASRLTSRDLQGPLKASIECEDHDMESWLQDLVASLRIRSRPKSPGPRKPAAA